MMPNVKGADATKKQIFIYSIILALTGLIPAFAGMAGWFYLATAAATGAVFVYLAYAVLKSSLEDKAPAKRLFAFSIFYLFAVFAALLIEDLVSLYV